MSALSDRCPGHIAVVLHIRDVALERAVIAWTEACRVQMAEHVAASWPGYAPPPGVFYYGNADGLPPSQAAVVGIFEDAGSANAAGYHSAIGKQMVGAVDLSRSDNPSRTLSHECCEIYRNSYLDAWAPGPVPPRMYAMELCDPVQRQGYTIRVRVLGQDRDIDVADFVTPAWFDIGSTDGKKDWCGVVARPFEIAPGGYQIARDGDSIVYLPAPGEAIGAAQISRPLSRTAQITGGVRIPRPARSKP